MATARSRRPAGAGRGTSSDNGEPTDPAAVAREICLRQLAARARSRAELAAVLRRRGISEEVAAQVLDRLTEVGLVDDRAFASAFVSSARAGRGLGRRALASELHRRGVEPEASAAALADIQAEDEEETARLLVARRLPRMSGLAGPVRARRLVAMLTRKGYELDLALKVVREAVGEEADDVDACPPEV